MVEPYSTRESELSSVVQVMVAPEDVMPDAWTAEISGGVTSLATATAIAADVVELPAASRATAVRAWAPVPPPGASRSVITGATTRTRSDPSMLKQMISLAHTASTREAPLPQAYCWEAGTSARAFPCARWLGAGADQSMLCETRKPDSGFLAKSHRRTALGKVF